MSETQYLTLPQFHCLLDAVDHARGAGSCVYVLDGEPACVVAQVAVRQGVSSQTLRVWDALGALENNVEGLLQNRAPGVEDLLSSFPYKLLLFLQRVWDRKGWPDEEETQRRRDLMREMIDHYRRTEQILPSALRLVS